MDLLKQQIEALVFCSEQSISIEEISASLKISFDWDLSDEEILSALEEIKLKYLSDDFAFELVEISEGFQFLTKKEFHPAISALIQHKSKKKLSVSQMETLAIIAYRQPISKSEIEHIRGVSCDYAVQKLLEKELIGISGKSDGPGRPVLYSTSGTFMDYFGIKSVKDLPQLKDLHMDQNEIGTPSESIEGSNENSSGENSAEEIENNYSVVEHEKIISETESEISAEAISTVEVLSGEIKDQENMDDISEDIDNSELPDRKSIYISNELENKEKEEDDSFSENESSEDENFPQ